jgi:hypothetical protein
VVLAGNRMSFRHVLHLQWVVQGPVYPVLDGDIPMISF